VISIADHLQITYQYDEDLIHSHMALNRLDQL